MSGFTLNLIGGILIIAQLAVHLLVYREVVLDRWSDKRADRFNRSVAVLALTVFGVACLTYALTN